MYRRAFADRSFGLLCGCDTPEPPKASARIGSARRLWRRSERRDSSLEQLHELIQVCAAYVRNGPKIHSPLGPRDKPITLLLNTIGCARLACWRRTHKAINEVFIQL